ncbi:tetratricopeptide repeat-containing diguanylate cyclase [Shewanella gaetbuli]
MNLLRYGRYAYPVLALFFGIIIISLTSKVHAYTERFTLPEEVYQAKTLAEKLSFIAWLSPQYAKSAQQLIEQLESAHLNNPLSDTYRLQLSFINCLNNINLGDVDSALSIAKQGAQQAVKLQLDHAKTYFVECEARALQQKGQSLLSHFANEEAIQLAQQYDQPQALLLALMTKAIRDSDLGHFTQAAEGMRLATALYPTAKAQPSSWFLAPKSYLNLITSNLMYSSGNTASAFEYAKKAEDDSQSNGTVGVMIAHFLARISLTLGDLEAAEQYLRKSQEIEIETHNLLYVAHFNAQEAFIEMHLGHLDKALQAITKSINHFSSIDENTNLMRANRTLAMIYFKQNKQDQAFALMSSIITKANLERQYHDLVDFHQVLSDFYVQNNNYEQAFRQQTLKFDASQKAHEMMADAQLAFFNASRSAANTNQHSVEKDTLSYKAQNIALLSVGILALLASYMIFINRKPKLESTIADMTDPMMQIEAALTQAKYSQYPLTLLLLNTRHIRTVDLGLMQTKIQKSLREQDHIWRLDTGKMAIILPFATENGAKKVLEQLSDIIKSYQNTPLNFGVATLQQPDNLQSLVKRAELNILTHYQKQKNRAS